MTNETDNFIKKIHIHQKHISNIIDSMLQIPVDFAIEKTNDSLSDLHKESKFLTLCRHHTSLSNHYRKLCYSYDELLQNTGKEDRASLLHKYSLLLLKWYEFECNVLKQFDQTTQPGSDASVNEEDIALLKDYLARSSDAPECAAPSQHSA